MSADDEVAPQAQMTKDLMIEVYRQDISCGNTAATARGEIGSRLKGLSESHGLNLRAYRGAKAMAKLPGGTREQTIRALLKYMVMLDCMQQQDMEDFLNNKFQGDDPRTDNEKVMDGQPPARDEEQVKPRSATNYTPQSDMGKHTLNRFKTNLDEAVTADNVNTALENFAEDHPKLAEEALLIARNRLEHINREVGDGVDMRSETVKQGETDRLAQSADTGKRSAKQKGGRKKAGDEDAPPAAAMH